MFEVKCKTCGKMFIPAPQHTLVDDRGYYCKPTCFLNRDRKGVRGKKSQKVIMCDLNGKELRVFRSASNAAESYIGYVKSIREACREGTPYLGHLWKYEETDNDQ